MRYKKSYLNYRIKRRIVLAICLLVLTVLYAFKNTSFLVRSLSAIGTLVAFYIIDHLFDIEFKPRHYIFVCFIAIASFLFSHLYFLYPNYDNVLHLVQPIMLSSLVFYMVSKLNLHLKWKLVFTFFIVIGFNGLFEIGEYLLDYFFDLKLQGVFLRGIGGLEKLDIILDRLDDTIIDMSLGIVGAGIYSLYVYFTKRKL